MPNFQRLNAGQKSAAIVNQIDSFRRKLIMNNHPVSSEQNFTISSIEDTTSHGRLLSHIREKIHVSENRSEIISLLTFMPDSWPTTKIVKYISHRFVTRYAVEHAVRLRKETGILSRPGARKGRRISKEQEQLIVALYEDDGNSRQMPGMKNVVSVKQDDGTKQKHQKRLPLVNVAQLYELFKIKYQGNLTNNEKVCCVSKFATLRPPWVVCVGCDLRLHLSSKCQVDAIGHRPRQREILPHGQISL